MICPIYTKTLDYCYIFSYLSAGRPFTNTCLMNIRKEQDSVAQLVQRVSSVNPIWEVTWNGGILKGECTDVTTRDAARRTSMARDSGHINSHIVVCLSSLLVICVPRPDFFTPKQALFRWNTPYIIIFTVNTARVNQSRVSIPLPRPENRSPTWLLIQSW